MVAAGVGLALSGLGISPGSVPIAGSALPSVGLMLPQDASFVGVLDVKRLASSAFYRKQAAGNASRLEAFRELEETTGLNPERDLDQLVLAGTKERKGVALAVGRFDQARVRRVLEARPGVARESVAGVSLYSAPGRTRHDANGLAFLDATTLVTGDPAFVRAVLEAHSRGQSPLRGNAALLALVARVRVGSTFWMVGDGALLASLPTGALSGSPGPVGSGLSLPTLKSFIVSGDVEPLVALSITGDTTDEAAARSVAETARGLLALFALQASRKPELKELGSAFEVTQNANHVQIQVRLPLETLEALRQKPGAPPVAPGAR
jgi:hypothetical protein